MASDATVAFLHVPKAAGTSYGQLLGQLLPGEHLIPDIGVGVSSVEFQRQVDLDDLRRYSLVAGHFDFDL